MRASFASIALLPWQCLRLCLHTLYKIFYVGQYPGVFHTYVCCKLLPNIHVFASYRSTVVRWILYLCHIYYYYYYSSAAVTEFVYYYVYVIYNNHATCVLLSTMLGLTIYKYIYIFTNMCDAVLYKTSRMSYETIQ